MIETTYYITQYPNGDESYHTKNCDYTTLEALEEALKIAKYLPIGSKIVFSDERKTNLVFAYVVERVGEHGICITEYNGNGEPTIIEHDEIANHFRGAKHAKA